MDGWRHNLAVASVATNVVLVGPANMQRQRQKYMGRSRGSDSGEGEAKAEEETEAMEEAAVEESRPKMAPHKF